MHEVEVTDHAVARYQERVVPALDLVDAERQLLSVLRFGEVVTEAPEWATGRQHVGMAAWALLGDGIAFPLAREGQSLVAVTCLTKLGCSEQTLARRRANRQGRRAYRRKLRHNKRPPMPLEAA